MLHKSPFAIGLVLFLCFALLTAVFFALGARALSAQSGAQPSDSSALEVFVQLRPVRDTWINYY